jgi:hypothetical protein
MFGCRFTKEEAIRQTRAQASTFDPWGALNLSFTGCFSFFNGKVVQI